VRKTNKSEPKWKPIKVSDRICIDLDADVKALCEASAVAVNWQTQRTMFNAALRHAFARYAAPGQQINISPFEQLVFTPPVRRLKVPRIQHID
jgi:hypothetical protein